MKYVYLLESRLDPQRHYVGLTVDVQRRLTEHNGGKSPYTAKYKPWKLETVIGFSEEEKAVDFEKYLKSGSGRSFSKKHF